jgi:hypothetical protein
MRRLLRKDWILNHRALLTTYALWSVLWLGFPMMRPTGNTSFNAWAVMVSLGCAFLPIIMALREDKYKGGALACSLPVTREAIVASRFVGGWLVALAGAAVAVGVMAVLSAAGRTELAAPAPGLFFGIVVTIGLVLALFLPFALRFGVTGVLVFLVAAQLAGIVTLLSAALFGLRGGPAVAIKGAAHAASLARTTLGPVAYHAVVLVLIAALNLASCRLSARIYRSRDF